MDPDIKLAYESKERIGYIVCKNCGGMEETMETRTKCIRCKQATIEHMFACKVTDDYGNVRILHVNQKS